MHDDKDNLTPDDEYQFPEDEFIQGESSGSPSIETNEHFEQEAKSAQRDKIMKIYERVREVLANRVVAAIIGVIILLICAHWFFSSSKKTTTPPVTTPVAQTQPVQTVAPTQPSPAVLSQLSGIKESANSMHDTVQALQNQMQQLQTDIAQNGQSHQQLANTLVQLSTRMNEMETTQKQLASELTKAPTHKKAKDKFKLPPVYYYTRAVVHNRAWIVGTNGQNITITIGSHVSGYGKILSINAETGVIETSSGKVIKFPPSDH